MLLQEPEFLWTALQYFVNVISLATRHLIQGTLHVFVSVYLAYNFCTFATICILLAKLAPFHDDVIKWKHFPRYWPLVRRIHRSQMNYPHKDQWRGALMFSLICLNKRLSKHSWGWWFETPSRSLWRHCNARLKTFSFVESIQLPAISCDLVELLSI